MPTKLLRKPSERFYSEEEIRSLLVKAHGREHLILRICINCGLPPSELFALRENDLQSAGLRIDEAVKEKERGRERIGDTKTQGSKAYVGISQGLREELEIWIHSRRQQRPYHASALTCDSDLLFPTETGTPFRIGNYLKRYLKPLARKVGIGDMTFAALRRTCATYFQVKGGPKATQTQLRHTQLSMTGLYIKQIPEEVWMAVEAMDQYLCGGTEQEPTLQ